MKTSITSVATREYASFVECCLQLFKAPEFVHKHLVNKHPEKHKIVVDKVRSVLSAFIALRMIVAHFRTPRKEFTNNE